MSLPTVDKLKVGDTVFSHIGNRKPIMEGVILKKLIRGYWLVKWSNGYVGRQSHLCLMLKE